ncbi:M16 family metallopeptidase, partial [Fusobacterium mortiferum]
SFTKETDGKYLLSNGIKVFSKKTDFDKDKIYIKLFKKEGSSSNDYTTFINSTIAPTIIEQSGVGNLKSTDIDTFMKGKNFSISSYISDYEQGFIISTDRKNLELALEYMNYLIYEPKVDKIIYENTISDLRESLNNRNNSPQIVYRDKIREIYSGKNNRKLPLSEKDLTLISPEKVLNIYKEKFSNFSEYNLIVVGSFNEEELEKNLKTYVASLPSENSKTIITPLDLKTPKNIVKEKVIKGVDKKATVTLIFPYNFKYGYEEKTLYNSFSQILNIALIEDIREKIGGVYSISSRTSLSPNNYGEDKMVISYSCDISRVDEIEKAVLQSLESLLYKDIDKEKINSVVKNYELSYNTEMKENSFWFNYLYQKITVPNYKLATPEEYKELVTKENIWKVNRKAINLKNYISVTLIPEKEEI